MLKSPLVVGYKGEIGSFILAGLLKLLPKASNIWCFDINDTEKEKIERIKQASCIFLCVPMEETIPWLLKYKKHLKTIPILEQTSLKTPIYGNSKLEDLNIWSMHILFRPSATPNINDRRTAVIGNINLFWSESSLDEIEKITSSKIIWFDNYKDHDKAMALEQALVHRVILALGEMLKYNHNTYMSNKVVELSDRIKLGDINLYKQIQKNKSLKTFLSGFKEKLYEVKF